MADSLMADARPLRVAESAGIEETMRSFVNDLFRVIRGSMQFFPTKIREVDLAPLQVWMIRGSTTPLVIRGVHDPVDVCLYTHIPAGIVSSYQFQRQRNDCGKDVGIPCHGSKVNAVVFANFSGTINPVVEATTKQRPILVSCRIMSSVPCGPGAPNGPGMALVAACLNRWFAGVSWKRCELMIQPGR